MNKFEVRQLKSILKSANKELKNADYNCNTPRKLTLIDEISAIKAQLNSMGEKV